jgi:hypothetical protein
MLTKAVSVIGEEETQRIMALLDKAKGVQLEIFLQRFLADAARTEDV